MPKTSPRRLDHLFVAAFDEIEPLPIRMADEVLRAYERQWKEGTLGRAAQKVILAEIKRTRINYR